MRGLDWLQAKLVRSTGNEFQEPAQVHNFITGVGWGNNYEHFGYKGDLVIGFTWTRAPIRVGDFLLWRAATHYVVAQVVEAHRYGDPADMTKVASRIVVRTQLLDSAIQLADEYALRTSQ